MAEPYFNYFTEIEEHFRRARGTSLFLLSPLDWAVIEGWKSAGIPLEAVLRGIDAAFEKWRARPPRARAQRVNSVAYCAQAVAREAQAMADGAPAPRRPPAPPFSMDDVRAYVAGNAGVLRRSGFAPLAELLEALDVGELYHDLEQLEQRLTAVEEKLVAQLRAAASDQALFAARRALDLELRPYRGKMSAEQLAMLERQFLERRLLEAAGLPRLSLFYL